MTRSASLMSLLARGARTTAGSRARHTLRSRLLPVLVSAALSTGLLGCVGLAPTLEPMGAEFKTSDLSPDEQYLWKQSREVQFDIEASGLLLEDAALDAYLASVLRRVTPKSLIDSGIEPRVQVISDVRIHGYSFANGVIYLHTALLSRLENETQLATILTRELAHVSHRHALRLKRDAKVRADAMAWLGVAASVNDTAASAKQLARAFEISSAIGFPHLLETTADREGLASLAAAGYAVDGAPRFFQNTLDYLEEIHAQGPGAWLPFSPPVQMTARISGYQALIDSEYPNTGEARPPLADDRTFRARLHPATRRQAELELAAGLFVSAEKTALLATESSPRDPEAFVLLGKARSGQRAKPIKGRPVPGSKSVREPLGKRSSGIRGMPRQRGSWG